MPAAECTIVAIKMEDAECRISTHGGTVISWKVAGKGTPFPEQTRRLRRFSTHPWWYPSGMATIWHGLFDSDRQRQHGFARDCTWRVDHIGPHECTMSLVASPSTHTLLMKDFRLELTTRLMGDGYALEQTLAVHAREDPLEFTCLLHTYFAADDLSQFHVKGLVPATCYDRLTGKQETVTEEPFPAPYNPDLPDSMNSKSILNPFAQGCEVDRSFFKEFKKVETVPALSLGSFKHNPKALHLNLPSLNILLETTEGFPDCVVWNPGPAKSQTLSSFDPEEWRRMVCVEVGALREPVRLGPFQSWMAKQRLLILEP